MLINLHGCILAQLFLDLNAKQPNVPVDLNYRCNHEHPL